MNKVFTAKFLQNLRNKKGEKGFTLIELLVVVIIIGVLAAVALPNLLGQVGKARETEAKNAMGTINRSQQAYHFEKQSFAPALATGSGTANSDLAGNNFLGAVVTSTFYSFATTAGDAADVTATASAVDSSRDGVRPYSSGIGFAAGQYRSVVCQTDQITNSPVAVVASTAPVCAANSTLLK